MSPEATAIPAQTQTYPGATAKMTPRPRDHTEGYVGTDTLREKVALITGADSGIVTIAPDVRHISNMVLRPNHFLRVEPLSTSS
jgi:hypothetical protein